MYSPRSRSRTLGARSWGRKGFARRFPGNWRRARIAHPAAHLPPPFFRVSYFHGRDHLRPGRPARIRRENLTALRFEGITSTLPLRFGRGAAQSDINGNEVVTSTVRSRSSPYGEYRVTPTSNLTDKGFTGHAQNDEVALIYMRARYYVPGVGRFASADTIVPDPLSPQAANRYSYTLGNPLRLTDPTGHWADEGCGVGTGCDSDLMGSTYLFFGRNVRVTTQPFDQWEEDGFRMTSTNYTNEYGEYLDQSAPDTTIYIYYMQNADAKENLEDFEIVARVMLNESLRLYIFDDPRFSMEMSSHWPIDGIAGSQTIYNRVNSGTYSSVSDATAGGQYALPILNPQNIEQSRGLERAYQVAWGVDAGYFVDTTYGCMYIWFYDFDPFSEYKETLWVGDWATGEYKAPGID